MYRHFETARLNIRPLHLDDKNFILELVNTKAWLQFIGNRKINTLKTAEEYIQKIIDNKNFFYSVFELKNTNLPIGIITFLYRDNHQHPDIGFAILPKFEKKGYAFEASNAYLDLVKKEIIEDKIIAITVPEKTASIKLIEKLGLIYEADFLDNDETLQLYSMKIK